MKKRFQQTDFWCDFKCAHGWSLVKQGDVNILVRTFKKAFVQFSLAYVPLAPEKSPSESDDAYIQRISEFSKSVKSSLPRHTLCLRYDIPLDFTHLEEKQAFVSSVPKLAKKTGLKIKKNSVDIQPPDSVILDLSKTEEELLSEMKNKWRYNVRYAAKHEVKVRAVTADSLNFESELDSFYNLYKTTAERDGIGLHPKSYYKDLMERGANSEKSASEKTKITLYIASHEGEDLAAIITLFNENEAVYLYGCSGNKKRNLMPAYLVQWTAICDAKAFGSKTYDFYGIPPTDDENHPMHGLYLFKTGFGGWQVHRPGSFDIPLSPLYSLYTVAENLRAFWHKKIMKKIRGR
ncbi:peptidoglycan bridge formation glycyltransferase FemA/FemB family protein [uncultured Treponema sp.]|uniref:lipid II:glycine glycyltransferase FemX n=1 Tax=uncultured Treponema sp. TaxID=162155 RepID=UPI0025D2627D|nr:peptidoglycan bridge formation glycyltransferase FemA/FemB family protein [uncultured Treponema sp.]